MKKREDFKLTYTTTVGAVEKWLEKGDEKSKVKLVKFINHRFNERYLKYVISVPSGFLKMAISCLLIETLQAFREGLPDTQGKGNIFERFFHEHSELFPSFNDSRLNFFKNIRCGILHQAETRQGWRLIGTGEQVDFNTYCINTWFFSNSVKKAFDKYLDELNNSSIESDVWKKAMRKIKAICDNCEIPN